MFIAAIEDAFARYAKDVEDGLDANNIDPGSELADGIDDLIDESNQDNEKQTSPTSKRQRAAVSPKDRKVSGQKAGTSKKGRQSLSTTSPSHSTQNVSMFRSLVSLRLLTVAY